MRPMVRASIRSTSSAQVLGQSCGQTEGKMSSGTGHLPMGRVMTIQRARASGKSHAFPAVMREPSPLVGYVIHTSSEVLNLQILDRRPRESGDPARGTMDARLRGHDDK